ncbi:MAG: hypothetical protein LBB75_05645 [Oscillospiraceae bacterium]|nr:hypothetical protein [Oscillospiraceae bacterium]
MAGITAYFMSIITTVALFFQCLFGIGGLGFGKVVLKLEKDAYPVGTETIEATLYNCTREPILVAPYYYSLERWEGGEWTPVTLKDSVFIPLANYFLQPFQSAYKPFLLTDHESVTAGRYRIQASGSVYAEFELK